MTGDLSRRALVRPALRGLLIASLSLWAGGCTLFGNAIGLEKRVSYDLGRKVPIDDPVFRRVMSSLGGGLTTGNSVEVLKNGEEIFPALLQAIGSARRSVNLEIYKFSNDQVGRRFAEALAGAALRGVEVRVLVDGTGSRLGPLRPQMERAGVRVATFRPVRPWTLHKIGRRTHRKMAVIDGVASFTGGFGIDERWDGDADSAGEWRDVAVKVTGPATAEVQALFAEDWTFTTGEILASDAIYPPTPQSGDVSVQAIGMSGNDTLSRANLLYYLALRSARRSIRIQNAYFVPDKQIREALADAARRGVDVQVMVPGRHIDKPVVRTVSRMYYGGLLSAGVKILEYDTSMLHNKVLVVDGLFSAVGSVNVDARSSRYNAEQSLVFYGRKVAARLEAMFDEDRAGCRDVSYAEWKSRGLDARVAERLLSLGRTLY